MNVTKKLLIVLAVVFTISTLPVVIHAADQGQGKGSPATEMKAGTERKGKHPEMMRALHALENAKQALEKAAHDYSGHRTKAIEHTEEAIKEVKAGLENDKK